MYPLKQTIQQAIPYGKGTTTMLRMCRCTMAGVDPDVQKTIAATDLSKEAANDWGVFTAGQVINKTLYNIRRERRSELMAEGFRYMDLRRWRAMDQMITTPYHIEGFKLWGPMKNW